MAVNPKQLMDAQDLQPKKSLGQNFLHDSNTLEKIVSSAELKPTDHVLEVGPGTGAMTVHLAQTGATVTAVEIDNRLIPMLQQQLNSYPNVRIVHGDILEQRIPDLVGDQPYVVVANLPYYITSAILRHLLEIAHKPKRLILTMQFEVAERITAKPDDMSLLAVSVQYYGKPQLIGKLSPAVFWPRPDVESAIVRIDVNDESPLDVDDTAAFFRVVKAGFGQKRKQLKNSLGAGMNMSHPQAAALISSAGIDPMRRAETLTLQEWAALTRVVAARSS